MRKWHSVGLGARLSGAECGLCLSVTLTGGTLCLNFFICKMGRDEIDASCVGLLGGFDELTSRSA